MRPTYRLEIIDYPSGSVLLHRDFRSAEIAQLAKDKMISEALSDFGPFEDVPVAIRSQQDAPAPVYGTEIRIMEIAP